MNLISSGLGGLAFGAIIGTWLYFFVRSVDIAAHPRRLSADMICLAGCVVPLGPFLAIYLAQKFVGGAARSPIPDLSGCQDPINDLFIGIGIAAFVLFAVGPFYVARRWGWRRFPFSCLPAALVLALSLRRGDAGTFEFGAIILGCALSAAIAGQSSRKAMDLGPAIESSRVWGVRVESLAASVLWTALAAIFLVVAPMFGGIYSNFAAEPPSLTRYVVYPPWSIGFGCLSLLIAAFIAGKDFRASSAWLNAAALMLGLVVIEIGFAALFLPMFGCG